VEWARILLPRRGVVDGELTRAMVLRMDRG
jgi:hypothetical protein